MKDGGEVEIDEEAAVIGLGSFDIREGPRCR